MVGSHGLCGDCHGFEGCVGCRGTVTGEEAMGIKWEAVMSGCKVNCSREMEVMWEGSYGERRNGGTI